MPARESQYVSSDYHEPLGSILTQPWQTNIARKVMIASMDITALAVASASSSRRASASLSAVRVGYLGHSAITHSFGREHA